MDGTPRTVEEAVNQLTAIVYDMAHEYAAQPADVDVLASEGFGGVMKAFWSFDPTRCCKFSTFAATCSRNTILEYLRGESRQPSIQLTEEIPTTGAKQLAEIIVTPVEFKPVLVDLTLRMIDDLTLIARRQERPRAQVIREALHNYIESKEVQYANASKR
jgi:RNA polymerase sigma factor (sigma-70 family)